MSFWEERGFRGCRDGHGRLACSFESMNVRCHRKEKGTKGGFYGRPHQL